MLAALDDAAPTSSESSCPGAASVLPSSSVPRRVSHTQTGKLWTYARVASIRKQHRIPTNCPIETAGETARGDGLLPVRSAAERLGVSLSLIHVWIQHGVLTSDQRTSLSKRW